MGAMTDNGREHVNKQLLDWATEAVDYGVGVILLSSIDIKGIVKGFDLRLTNKVTRIVECPEIAHSGARTIEDIVVAAKHGASGEAIASMLHYDEFNINEIKESLVNNGIFVRMV
jgi:cyclase